MCPASLCDEGVFVKIDEPLLVGTPVALRIEPPPPLAPFEAAGQVRLIHHTKDEKAQIGMTIGLNWVAPGNNWVASYLKERAVEAAGGANRPPHMTRASLRAAPTIEERRRFHRYPLHLKVVPPMMTGTVMHSIDVGMGGMQLWATESYPVGTQFTARIHHRKKDYWVALRCEVTRSAPKRELRPTRMAVKFVNLISRDRRGFDEFLRSSLSAQIRKQPDSGGPSEVTKVVSRVRLNELLAREQRQ